LRPCNFSSRTANTVFSALRFSGADRLESWQRIPARHGYFEFSKVSSSCSRCPYGGLVTRPDCSPLIVSSRLARRHTSRPISPAYGGSVRVHLRFGWAPVRMPFMKGDVGAFASRGVRAFRFAPGFQAPTCLKIGGAYFCSARAPWIFQGVLLRAEHRTGECNGLSCVWCG